MGTINFNASPTWHFLPLCLAAALFLEPNDSNSHSRGRDFFWPVKDAAALASAKRHLPFLDSANLQSDLHKASIEPFSHIIYQLVGPSWCDEGLNCLTLIVDIATGLVVNSFMGGRTYVSSTEYGGDGKKAQSLVEFRSSCVLLTMRFSAGVSALHSVLSKCDPADAARDR